VHLEPPAEKARKNEQCRERSDARSSKFPTEVQALERRSVGGLLMGPLQPTSRECEEDQGDGNQDGGGSEREIGAAPGPRLDEDLGNGRENQGPQARPRRDEPECKSRTFGHAHRDGDGDRKDRASREARAQQNVGRCEVPGLAHDPEDAEAEGENDEAEAHRDAYTEAIDENPDGRRGQGCAHRANTDRRRE
jgi:hypothetical protein